MFAVGTQVKCRTFPYTEGVVIPASEAAGKNGNTGGSDPQTAAYIMSAKGIVYCYYNNELEAVVPAPVPCAEEPKFKVGDKLVSTEWELATQKTGYILVEEVNGTNYTCMFYLNGHRFWRESSVFRHTLLSRFSLHPAPWGVHRYKEGDKVQGTHWTQGDKNDGAYYVVLELLPEEEKYRLDYFTRRGRIMEVTQELTAMHVPFQPVPVEAPNTLTHPCDNYKEETIQGVAVTDTACCLYKEVKVEGHRFKVGDRVTQPGYTEAIWEVVDVLHKNEYYNLRFVSPKYASGFGRAVGELLAAGCLGMQWEAAPAPVRASAVAAPAPKHKYKVGDQLGFYSDNEPIWEVVQILPDDNWYRIRFISAARAAFCGRRVGETINSNISALVLFPPVVAPQPKETVMFAKKDSTPVATHTLQVTDSQHRVLRVLFGAAGAARCAAIGAWWIIKLSPILTGAAIALPQTRPSVLNGVAQVLQYFAGGPQ